MKIGSLCTGYGGLDLAVEAHFNAETIWCAEFDKYASQVIEQRFAIPNYGDIKLVDWASLPQIDILTAGYPCQPFSTAGQRKGTDDSRHIWPFIKEGISVLRPGIVVLENVRGHLTLGFKEVLKGLTEIGYDARWQIVRASDAGAAHQRARLFIIAYSKGGWSGIESSRVSQTNSGLSSDSGKDLQRANSDSIGFSLEHDQSRAQGNQGESQSQFGELVKGVTSATIPSNTSSPRFSQIIMDKFHKTNHRTRGGIALDGEPLTGIWWRDTAYEAAIERWRAIQGEPPSPLMGERLNPKFVEWMMGLPNGWVTECGLSVTQQLKMLGNGVVPQQAKLALELLTDCEYACG